MREKLLRYPVLLFLFVLFAGNNPAQAQAATISAIPFQYYQSLIFIKAKINGGRTQYLFLLNTSANVTVIDKRAADLLKLPVIRETDSVEGTAGIESIGICKLRSLEAGKAVVRNMEVTKRDLSKFVTLNGQKIDGILGTDFLRHFSVTINFVKKNICFQPRKTPVGKQKHLPFSIEEGIPRFTVRLNDTLNTYLHYNSGVSMAPSRNNYINVSYGQWCDLKKCTPYMNHSSYFSGRGVGGDVYLQAAKIYSLQLDSLVVIQPYVIVQAKEGYFKRDDAIGFFGNNLLEKQKIITLDFLSGQLIFMDAKKQPVKAKKKKPAWLVKG